VILLRVKHSLLAFRKMLGNFDIPSVDHLREGIDYVIMDWDFAAPPVTQPPPGQPCPTGTKMIFGLCRRLKGSGDWASGDDTDKERELKQQAEKEGSAFENNKAIQASGKKYGWAKKNGKPVIVLWGSVAGTKPKPATPLATGSQPVATQAATLPRPVA
jgi:hypothetical protein